MTAKKVETPELDKMRAVKAESAVLTRFVDWLEENDTPICQRAHFARDPEYVRITESYEKLFARFFEIDLDKVEAERRAILDALREEHEG